MTTFKPMQLDLASRAHLEMVMAGLLPDFDKAAKKEAHDAKSYQAHTDKLERRDLRELLWSSIDNPDSRDLDQLEYAEKLPYGTYRLVVAIADVDAYVKKNSAIDVHAASNTTSVYTGIVTFPMLPEELSYDLTSLLEGVDREAMVVDMLLNEDGNVTESSIYPAIVHNHAKLNYEMVGRWLEIGGPAPEKIADTKGLTEQIHLQNDIAQKIQNWRDKQGSLVLKTLEATPITADGTVIDLVVVESNPARLVIENFMISANRTVSKFLEKANVPSIKRIVKIPDRWDRIVEVAEQYGEKLPHNPDARALREFLLSRKEEDPLRFPDLSLTIVKLLGRGEYVIEVPGQKDIGHFALAVRNYTHSTAPNRRYPDMVTQRLLKAVLTASAIPYSMDQLEEIALNCNHKEEAANKVERTMRKLAAAVLLSSHIGETYEGIVTGKKAGATFVRLIKPPAEGMIVRGQHGVDVGDKVKVRLVEIDLENAYIDFARVGKHHR
ncbi:MAG: RNB domain-containing ribonuclease [Candidatus Obscuribacterales bacterium]|nr:RNB domain-containing ribonuclease [Candidatus Obscuribacterales bacterium]